MIAFSNGLGYGTKRCSLLSMISQGLRKAVSTPWAPSPGASIEGVLWGKLLLCFPCNRNQKKAKVKSKQREIVLDYVFFKIWVSILFGSKRTEFVCLPSWTETKNHPHMDLYPEPDRCLSVCRFHFDVKQNIASKMPGRGRVAAILKEL